MLLLKLGLGHFSMSIHIHAAITGGTPADWDTIRLLYTATNVAEQRLWLMVCAISWATPKNSRKAPSKDAGHDDKTASLSSVAGETWLNISLPKILPNKEWELRVITLKALTLFSQNYKSTGLLNKIRLNTAAKTQW